MLQLTPPKPTPIVASKRKKITSAVVSVVAFAVDVAVDAAIAKRGSK